MKPPRKLSAAIRLGLSALAKVERRPSKYEVYMYDAHEPSETGRCRVCLAGSVMVALGAKPDEWRFFNDYPEWESVLEALDQSRKGNVGGALRAMLVDADISHVLAESYARDHKPPPRYELDRRGFKRQLRVMAKWLEARGL